MVKILVVGVIYKQLCYKWFIDATINVIQIFT
jgi:hypothetical protein